jgi:hypothetical protein
MFRIGNSIVNELVAQLDRNDSVDTGLLKNSIRMELTDKKITIIMNGYGKNVEYGTPIGTKVSIEALKGWCKRKLGDEDLAFAVAKKIEEEGIEPRPFIRPVLHQKLPMIIARSIK